MREDKKTIQAIDAALNRIQERPASQVSTADLQLLMLKRLDDRLRELVRLQSKNITAEPDTSAPSEVSEPRPVKKKRRSFFNFR